MSDCYDYRNSNSGSDMNDRIQTQGIIKSLEDLGDIKLFYACA